MMFRRIKRTLTGWKSSSYDIYKEIYSRYGGSVNMHPDAVRFFMERHKWKFEFFHFERKGEIHGAYFIANNQQIGLLARREYPLNSDEIMLPFSDKLRCFLPDCTNKLATHHKMHIINATWTIARKKRNCLVKERFSPKFEKRRRNEFRNFIRNGGSVRLITEHSIQEIADIYFSLFHIRYDNSVPCYKYRELVAFLMHMQKHLCGHILYWRGEPCAIDLVLKSESASNIYYDNPMGVVRSNSDCMRFSPSSVLIWLNIEQAREYSICNQKKMFFSMGALTDEWKYKLLWTSPHTVGKSLF
ncbi:antimicrobial resistance protein Mig-14 [Escherichia coli]|nr:antimicrobial resistance protein Mig-14 [Escherichia coli]MDS1618190.1 antimicrobial resistance protein Mig-14 [Escherichia coli]